MVHTIQFVFDYRLKLTTTANTIFNIQIYLFKPVALLVLDANILQFYYSRYVLNITKYWKVVLYYPTISELPG